MVSKSSPKLDLAPQARRVFPVLKRGHLSAGKNSRPDKAGSYVRGRTTG
jgi:hypothetical protein